MRRMVSGLPTYAGRPESVCRSRGRMPSPRSARPRGTSQAKADGAGARPWPTPRPTTGVQPSLSTTASIHRLDAPSRLEPAGQRQIRRGRGAPTQYPGACLSRSSCARRPGPHPTSSSLHASRCSVLSVLLPCRPLSLSSCPGRSVSSHGGQLPRGWRTGNGTAETSATGTRGMRGGRYGRGGRRVLWQRQRG